jgi:hypothetical protein|nr:MAG TPA: NikA, BACTERIAL CONJUGATION, RELAXASE, DNA [Caudoviricetes sp.]
MAEEDKQKASWGGARANSGGARPGAGRKKINGDIPTKRVQFRLTAEQEVLVREYVKRIRDGNK